MRRRKFNWLRIGAIWIAGAAAILIVSFFVPTLQNASINMLFRLRGELPAPDDIVLVAIDDASLQRIGKYPWSRQITAEGLDKITAGEPKAVGLDIIYAEESEPEDDQHLAEAIGKNRRVVLPVQLFETESETVPGQTEIIWLLPLTEFGEVAAGKGHAHAAPDVDGTLRSIQLSKADDKGNRFWAFGLEILRVAEQISPGDFEENQGVLRFGTYAITLVRETAAAAETAEKIPGVTVVRSNEMLINYVGATKSFRQYSFADVLSGAVSPETFRDKIVLVGATSPTLGDIQVTPFMHYASEERQGGQAMPGVEVHANVINTIKSRIWLGFLPGFWNLALAFLIIPATTLAVKFLDGWRQIVAFAVILTAIVAGAIIAFNHYFLILPLPEMLTAFLAAVPLLLLDRSLAASRDLDAKLHMLSEVQKGFLLDENDKKDRQNRLGAIVPRNLEWKLEAVDDITARLLTRMSFINRVLSGMTDGVLVADTRNRIVFVNENFSRLALIEAKNLLGQDFIEFSVRRKIFSEKELRDTLESVLSGKNYETEFEIAAPQTKHFLIRFSPVTAGDDALSERFGFSTETPVIGILIMLADITEQRELDRLKAETLQLVSHELRSPLTSIQGLSDVLRKFPVSESESQEMLDTIHAEAVRLNEMISRFLDVKRLESGNQELQFSEIDVENLLAQSVSSISPTAAEKQIEIRHKTNSSLPVLRADSPLLAQAVVNLLSNAVKYSPTETFITVEALKADSELKIIIKDNGYGIPPESLERIFDKFYRLNRDETSETIGTGLGLSFVKEVAEKHGGRVSVESEENIGSTFTLHLPYRENLSHYENK